jgi:DNA-binding IclR family transcriptional regulator
MEYLEQLDDFATARKVAEAVGLERADVSRALHVLHQYHAVESSEQGGVLYWLATPLLDTRVRIVAERAPETQKRRLKVREVQK